MMNDTLDPDLSTMNGAIALVNLQAQIGGLVCATAVERSEIAPRADLVDLLALRGHVLGRIGDYERAEKLAEDLVRTAPADGLSFLARARTRAAFHLFDEALADLGAAEQLGLAAATLDAERATIFHAAGRYTVALALCQNAVERRPDFAAFGALAGLHAEQGDVDVAEPLFGEALRRYRGASPFPVAQLDFRRGLMWLERGDPGMARVWFDAAVRRVPAYAPAQGRLAAIDATLGEREAAEARLRPLTVSSDDPEYAGQLAGLLHEAGEAEEARTWRERAAARYDELIARHPAAFAEHAAEFWLGTGADPQKALSLAEMNLRLRRTDRAQELLRRAALACPPVG
jgi:tetratricopeptide (TPR) repeat protein